jgi:hypothetical protein
VGLVVTLVLPATAEAAPSTWLSLDATRVAPGWTLKGSVVKGSGSAEDVVVGLTLSRALAAGSGEDHALRAHGRRTTISFDGRNGRWRANGQLGTVATVDMRIRSLGTSTSAGEILGCFAQFRRVRVRLTGTLVLRTGTRFFKTIRRRSLTGSIVYSPQPVVCGPKPAVLCESSSWLGAGGPSASLNASPRLLVVQFSEQARGAPAGVRWYHVARLGGYDALKGMPPSLTVSTPSRGIVSGSATFSGADAEEAAGECPTTTYHGTAAGTLRATFAGWGARTLTLKGAEARYRTTGNRP